MTERNELVVAVADEALKSDAKMASLVDSLSTSARRTRQQAASAVHYIAKTDPEKLVGYIDEFIDALNRPEAQTRWELMETLSILVDYDARSCGKALPEVETCLFDEDSGMVRLCAVRFLCKYGATTAVRSEKVWPLLDEAIQCYHGDLEFNDMLVALVEFSQGKLDDGVKSAYAERMKFDAANAKGTLGKRAQQIVENLS